MIFVDTNILIDLVVKAVPSQDWSRLNFKQLTREQGGTINAIVLAEFAPRFANLAEMRAAVSGLRLVLQPIDDASAFRAATAFRAYRLGGGPRTTMIPDFLIGAHAATLGIPLLTRDPRGFGGYFPELALITPESHP